MDPIYPNKVVCLQPIIFLYISSHSLALVTNYGITCAGRWCDINTMVSHCSIWKGWWQQHFQIITFVFKAWLWNYTLLLPCTLAVSHQLLHWLPRDDQKPIPSTATNKGCALWSLRVARATSPALGTAGTLLPTFPPGNHSALKHGDCWTELTKSQKEIAPEISPHPSLGPLYCNVCTWNTSEVVCVYFKSLPKRTLDEIKTEKDAWVNLLQIQGLNVTFLTWKNSSVYLTKTFH